MTSEAVPVTPDKTRGNDLNAIMARADAATKGPWSATANCRVIGPRVEPLPHSLARAEEALAETGARADAEFIAAARTDVPALVAEVRVLRDQRDKALDEHVESGGTCSTCVDWSDNPADWPCATVVALTGKDTE